MILTCSNMSIWQQECHISQIYDMIICSSITKLYQFLVFNYKMFLRSRYEMDKSLYLFQIHVIITNVLVEDVIDKCSQYLEHCILSLIVIHQEANNTTIYFFNSFFIVCKFFILKAVDLCFDLFYECIVLFLKGHRHISYMKLRNHIVHIDIFNLLVTHI